MQVSIYEAGKRYPTTAVDYLSILRDLNASTGTYISYPTVLDNDSAILYKAPIRSSKDPYVIQD